jgi:hypothetical protein
MSTVHTSKPVLNLGGQSLICRIIIHSYHPVPVVIDRGLGAK